MPGGDVHAEQGLHVRDAVTEAVQTPAPVGDDVPIGIIRVVGECVTQRLLPQDPPSAITEASWIR